jgi:hypothetical protein
METSENFKNSPLHDKKAIIEMMDEFTPEQMVNVVECLKLLKLNLLPDVGIRRKLLIDFADFWYANFHVYEISETMINDFLKQQSEK